MKHEITAAALIVFMGLGIAGNTRQDIKPGRTADAPKVFEFKGLRLSVAKPELAEGKPIVALLTAENPSSEERVLKIPIQILCQDSNPMSRVPAMPKVIRSEEIEVLVDGGKKQVCKIRLADSWTAPKQFGGSRLTYFVQIAKDKDEPKVNLLTLEAK